MHTANALRARRVASTGLKAAKISVLSLCHPRCANWVVVYFDYNHVEASPTSSKAAKAPCLRSSVIPVAWK